MWESEERGCLEEVGALWCGLLLGFVKKKWVISQTVKKSSPVTQREKGEDCGEELCWGDSFLHCRISWGKTENIKWWPTAECLTCVQVKEMVWAKKTSCINKETFWNLLRRKKTPKTHDLFFSLVWPWCSKKNKKPQIKQIKPTTIPHLLFLRLAVRLAYMMQLEFQMLLMEFCSISGLQMWLNPPHSSLLFPQKSLVIPLSSPSSSKHCSKVETNGRPTSFRHNWKIPHHFNCIKPCCCNHNIS